MGNDRYRHGVDRTHAECDQQGRDHGDGRAEAVYALQEGREHPAQRHDDEQFVAGHQLDAAPQGVVSARMAHHVVEQQGRPDDIQDEQRVPDALGRSHRQRIQRRRERQDRDGRCDEDPGRAGLLRGPAHGHHQDNQRDDRQRRKQPMHQTRGGIHGRKLSFMRSRNEWRIGPTPSGLALLVYGTHAASRGRVRSGLERRGATAMGGSLPGLSCPPVRVQRGKPLPWRGLSKARKRS